MKNKLIPYFLVTNTGTLIQTGQLVWTISVFAMLGVTLLMVGFAVLGKPGEVTSQNLSRF